MKQVTPSVFWTVALVLVGWMGVLTWAMFRSDDPEVNTNKNTPAEVISMGQKAVPRLSDMDSSLFLANTLSQPREVPFVVDTNLSKFKTEGGPVVAFVQGDQLQQNLDMLRSMQAEFQQKMVNREQQLQNDALPLQTEAQELIEYANGPDVQEDEMVVVQQRMMEIENALYVLQQQAEEEMLLAEQEMKIQLSNALRVHLEQHAIDNGIDIIFNWGLSGEGVLYGGSTWDITADVLERINGN